MSAPETRPPPGPSWLSLPPAYRAGSILYYAGILGFASGVGATVGYYFADQGLPWLPDMVSAILAITSLSTLAVIVGRWARGRAFTETAHGQRIARRTLLAVLVAMVLMIGHLAVYWAEQPTTLTELTPLRFEQSFALDSARYREFDGALERNLLALEASPAFGDQANGLLQPGDERLLREAWVQTYDYAFALDQLRLLYEDWYRFDPSRTERPQHLRSFLLTYSAELALYEKSARLVELVQRNPAAKKFLDSPHPEQGLPANTYSMLRQDLTGTRDQVRVLAGERYLQLLDTGFNGRHEARVLGVAWLWRAAEHHLSVIKQYSLIDRTSHTVTGDLQIFQRAVRRTWYPAQKGVAEWFGDTRTRRVGWYLITPEQVAEVDPLLKPGDVLLSRKNWYLSNIGLPGFWPHALLYLGAPDKFNAYFDDPQVRGWVLQRTGRPLSFGEYLAQEHPKAWLNYTLGQQADPANGQVARPHHVIEAVSDGVVFNTLEHAAGDYLAAMSPRLDTLARAQAIDEAFRFFERPYDFDFDFATDHAVVCTELVWRAYRPDEGKQGLDLELVEVAGRMTLPANELVRQYALGHEQGEPQLDFVTFLDAREKEQRAVVSDEASFRSSWQRVKWDVAQQ